MEELRAMIEKAKKDITPINVDKWVQQQKLIMGAGSVGVVLSLGALLWYLL